MRESIGWGIRVSTAAASLLLCFVASGQMAPTGDHYAARPSDSGFAGAVNSQGGYGASIPLDLPAIRGNLPVPLRVSFGGREVGAAGLGWDIPLTYLRRSTTIAHNRPANFPDLAPRSRERVTLVLDGESIDLVRNASDTAWTARRNGPQLEVRAIGSGSMVMNDGNGLTYEFSAQGNSAGSRLDGATLSLLRNVTGPGGDSVHLEYDIGAPNLPGGATGLSINLASVSYNRHPSGACFKNRINLNYDSPSTGSPALAPLAMSMLNSVVLARLQKLVSVDVTSRSSCGSGDTSLRKYLFAYQNDPDTQRPQLQQVTMIGQQGTAERSITLPVASYSYGQVTDGNGKFSYRLTERIDTTLLPTGMETTFGIASTHVSELTEIPGGLLSAAARTRQNLVDLNGDGRSDLMVHGGIALNAPLFGAGKSRFTFDATSLGVSWFVGYQESQSVRQVDNRIDRFGSRNRTWRENIDFNGDGRLDTVDAGEVLNAWVVYLNTPDPTNPNKITWSRRLIDARPIAQRLIAAGAGSDGWVPGFGGTPPLSQTANVQNKLYNQCWKWATDNTGTIRWILTIEGYSGPVGNRCAGPQGQLLGRDDYASIDLPPKTITEWELRDINGDGYPDLVYNASPVGIVLDNESDGPNRSPNPPPAQPGAFVGQFAQTQRAFVSDIKGSKDVLVLFNVAGVHLSAGDEETLSTDDGTPYNALIEGTSAFSAPITLETAAPPGVDVPTPCGVSRWGNDPSALMSEGIQSQECGFEDVNGDGLVDRVRFTPTSTGFTRTAALGTGNIGTPFSSAAIILPGPIARVESHLIATDELGHFKPQNCPEEPTGSPGSVVPHDIYPIQRTAGLRDINGDGVPDYVVGQNGAGTTAWSAALGTGTGFAPAKPIEIIVGAGSSSVGFELSMEKVGCFAQNTSSATSSGLYELDGDGVPEVISLANNGLNVYKLNATHQDDGTNLRVAPTSGRLLRIGNGYGSYTDIRYRSAKEDAGSDHLVPYPEIVVTSEEVNDSTGAPLLATTRYAYGGARLIFDATSDAFYFPGYQRSVALQGSGAADVDDGVAVFTDSYGLRPFISSMDASARFKRNLIVGQVRDVTTISGDVGTDPWSLLATNINTDTRRISGSHYEWDARLLAAGPTPAGGERCIDMMLPYDFDQSNGLQLADDQCTIRGFLFEQDVFSWEGHAFDGNPFDSTATVQTNVEIKAVDDLGRITEVLQDNDLRRQDDDLCVQTAYAAPAGTDARLLNAPKSRSTARLLGTDAAAGASTGCGQNILVLSKETVEYDNRHDGTVSNGFVTSRSALRADATTGVPIDPTHPDLHLFDASYDANGNPISVTTSREDGATRTVTTGYDPFGLAVVSVQTEATNVDGTHPPLLTSTATVDPITLDVQSATDENGAVGSSTYDGFGRVLLSKVKPAGGVEGVLSSMKYNGFAVGQTGGRQIVQKVFADPVPVANVGTAEGRLGTVFLDQLGREQRTDVELGADYANQKLIVGHRSYDSLGRVAFDADPYLAGQNFSNQYGTTYTFELDGKPSCVIRGFGVQSLETTDEASERYPTCYDYTFSNGIAHVFIGNADASLSASPQAGVRKREHYTAIGRLVESDTTNDHLEHWLERSTFAYDALGHLNGMTRYGNPDPFVTDQRPVATAWRYDSLGQILELDDPGSAPQNRSYSNWGELTLVQWNDPTITTPGGNDRRTLMKYDALGRLTHSEDRTKNIVDAETINDYVYDQGFNTTVPPVTATNVLGRMTKAIAPTSTVTFSYDGLGRINAQTFVDTTVSSSTAANVYVETQAFHADGTLQASHLQLPDNLMSGTTLRTDERIDYSYDSAGRTRSVKYNDGTSRDLFTAIGANDIDVFGRIRNARYGVSTFTADYADTGRRLLLSTKVASPAPLSTSREIAFPVVPATPASITPFDPVGRERVRLESTNGIASPFATLRSYDPLGQLATSDAFNLAVSIAAPERAFTYDPLGNLSLQNDINRGSTSHPGTVRMSYQSTDRDRICSVGYGSATPPATCNVKYDGVGNIVEMPTRTSGIRTLSFLANGQIKSIVSGGTNASFKYDAFGGVQQLTVNSTTSTDTRSDKHFGEMLTQRKEGGATVLNRSISAPGLIATRHGPSGGWTFVFGEARGNRFVTDQNGAFVQDIDYHPFGEVRNPSGALPGTTNYTTEQWNGGDALAALGVSQLGARIYDPTLGRFLSRDPLLIPRTATTTNPYAFAMNDPVNMADSSGLDASFPDARDPTENGRGAADPTIESFYARYAPGDSCYDSGLNCPGGTFYVRDPKQGPSGVNGIEVDESDAEIEAQVNDSILTELDKLLPTGDPDIIEWTNYQGPGHIEEAMRQSLLDSMRQSLNPRHGGMRWKRPAFSKLRTLLAKSRSSGPKFEIVKAKKSVIIGIETDLATQDIAKTAKSFGAYHPNEVLVIGHGDTLPSGALSGDALGTNAAEIIHQVNRAKIMLAKQGVRVSRATLAICGAACGSLARDVAAGTGLPVRAPLAGTTVIDTWMRRRGQQRVTLPVLK